MGKSGEEHLLPPPMIEEGYIELREKTKSFNQNSATNKFTLTQTEKVMTSVNPYFESVHLERKKIYSLQKEGRNDFFEAQILKTQLLDEINTEVKATSMEIT